MVNGFYDMVKFTLPEFAGDQWLTSVHTNDPDRREGSTLKTDAYKVTGCSLLLHAALTSGEPVKVTWRLALDLSGEALRQI